MPYLAILATLEKGRHPNEADVVIPHHRILGVVSGDLELVLEHCIWSALVRLRKPLTASPTFETLTPSLFVEIFFATIVRDMRAALPDTTKRCYLKSHNLPHRSLVNVLVGVELNGTPRTCCLCKASRISHLDPREDRSVERR